MRSIHIQTILLISSFICTAWFALPANVLAQASSVQAKGASDLAADGLVLERQKYSFTLQTEDRTYKVQIPNGTPMLMKLTKPRFDLTNRTVSISLMLSSDNGRVEDDQVLSWPLSEPVFVSSMFRNEKEMGEALSDKVRTLDRYVVSSKPVDVGPLTFGGELSQSRTQGQYFVNDNGGVHTVKLGSRRGLLHGFTITDLKPLQTSVWVQGRFDGETLVASRIRFEYLGDSQQGFDDSLPDLLSLGDITSYDYQRPLIEALSGKVNVHHPPTWLGPSKNWKRLHHYVGQLDTKEPAWDVITFNFGIRDQFQSREAYQSNLRNAIRVLNRTGAKLVWVNSTPLPNGFPAGNPSKPLDGYVRGRMDLQNRWSRDVLSEHPEIAVCDLWQIVKSNDGGLYDGWWADRHFNFYYPQSIPLGRSVAAAALRAIGSADQPNSESVHGNGSPMNTSR